MFFFLSSLRSIVRNKWKTFSSHIGITWTIYKTPSFTASFFFYKLRILKQCKQFSRSLFLSMACVVWLSCLMIYCSNHLRAVSLFDFFHFIQRKKKQLREKLFTHTHTYTRSSQLLTCITKQFYSAVSVHIVSVKVKKKNGKKRDLDQNLYVSFWSIKFTCINMDVWLHIKRAMHVESLSVSVLNFFFFLSLADFFVEKIVWIKTNLNCRHMFS